MLLNYISNILNIHVHAFVNYDHFVHSGLPVPIVAIAAGIANEHYGTERGLVLLMVIHCSVVIVAFSYTSNIYLC